MTHKDTIVGKWLSVSGAGDYTQAFFDKGYKELRDVTKDVIETIVKNNPELAAKLVGSAAELNGPGVDPTPQPQPGSGPPAGPGKPPQTPPASTVGIPPLPHGTTLDLTHPTIRVPNLPEFTVPAVLSVGATSAAVVSPTSLTPEDWIIIAKTTNVLRAYTLGDPAENSDPPRATTFALDWMVPTSADFFEPMHLRASVLSEVTYSSETASYVQAGFDKQSASISIPWATASFERQRKEKEAKASHKKTIYMIGRWFYPRAKLHLNKCTKASKGFTTAIEAALNANDAAAVERLFNTYGRAFPQELVIGGQLSFVHSEVCEGNVSETEVEKTIKAAVSAKANGAEAAVGVSFGNAASSRVTADRVNKLTKFDARGGDAMLATNPQLWPDSVKDPNRWAVIGVSKMAPVTEWLEPALKARLERLLPAIEVSQDVPTENHSARVDSDGFLFGMRTSRFQTKPRGGLEFVCGTSGSPALGQGDAVGASATFHYTPTSSADMWIEGASICLPVPKGSHYSVKKWDDYSTAVSQFQRAETKLTFGKWQTLADKTGLSGAGKLAAFARGAQDSNGFIFCSVRAPANGDRGFVSCTVDGKILGAASVHNHPLTTAGCWSPHACFCVPVPRHLPMSLDATASYGRLDIKVWYLASTSQGWKFGPPEPYTLNMSHTADTDGFLSGVVTVREGNARGMLFLFCGSNKDKLNFMATMAVHQTSNRYIPYASAMLPVRRDFFFRSDPGQLSADPGHKGATVEAYWTPLLPVT
jgi:hypothetical protein